MTKRHRKPRAKHKIESASAGALIPVDDPALKQPPAEVDRSLARVTVKRTTLLSTELEAVIEIIARERVYREMLARLERRLLTGPSPFIDEQPPTIE